MTLLTGPAEKTLLMLEERALCLFILLASPKKKQTNKQTERTLAGTPQQLWPAGLSERKYFDNHNNKKDRFKNDFLISSAFGNVYLHLYKTTTEPAEKPLF